MQALTDAWRPSRHGRWSDRAGAGEGRSPLAALSGCVPRGLRSPWCRLDAQSGRAVDRDDVRVVVLVLRGKPSALDQITDTNEVSVQPALVPVPGRVRPSRMASSNRGSNTT